jgi:uncharacterized cupin superfamily protein
MEKVDIEELESWMSPATIKRPVGKALGAENLAINYYELSPGDSFAFGYHAHAEQEETFYILEGTVTFETEDGDIDVGPDEVIHFEAGEFQRGWNRGDERVEALAMGAPQEGGELTLLCECENCGERTDHVVERAEDGDALVTVCEDCGAETARYT